MLILQKNSFNRKDKITNIGFIISLSLIVLVFLLLPLIFRLLQITGMKPSVIVLLPSAIIIPSLCVVMFFTGKPGGLLRKLKLINLRPRYIPICLAVALLVLFAVSPIMYIYHELLTKLNIPAPPPLIEEILRNSDLNSLLWICFGVIILAPISEELIFRRFLFGFLAPRWGYLPALLITSGIFALIHFSLHSLPALFVLGIAFQLIYLKFGSLYPAIIMHAFNNAIAISVFFLIQ